MCTTFTMYTMCYFVHVHRVKRRKTKVPDVTVKKLETRDIMLEESESPEAVGSEQKNAIRT